MYGTRQIQTASDAILIIFVLANLWDGKNKILYQILFHLCKSWGPTNAISPNLRFPVEFFLLLSDTLLEHTLYQTSLYKNQSRKMFLGTSDSEIKVFVGINLLMGNKENASYRDYWPSCSKLERFVKFFPFDIILFYVGY